MFEPGQKVHCVDESPTTVLTVKAISPDGKMIEIEEYGGWVWADRYVLLENQPILTDVLDEQLKFLGL